MRIQLPMLDDPGMGIVLSQAEQQGIEGGALCIGTRVGRSARRGESPFVADADAVAIESLDMRSLLMERTTGMYHPVARDVVVITDVGKTASFVVAPTIFQCIGTVATRGAAMQYDQVDESVVLVLAARENRHAHRA